MKESTKHIFVKELVFFFKWLAIGLVVFIATSLIFTFLEKRNGTIESLDYILPALLFFCIGLPLWLYVCRGGKWLIKRFIKQQNN